MQKTHAETLAIAIAIKSIESDPKQLMYFNGQGSGEGNAKEVGDFIIALAARLERDISSDLMPSKVAGLLGG